MAPDLTIATAPRLELPDALHTLPRVEISKASRVEADIVLARPEGFHAWLRANPHLPVLALDGDRVVGLGLLGARLVPHPDARAADLIELFEALTRVLSLLEGRAVTSRPAIHLSRRERQVLQHLAGGATLARTADRLGIAETTAKNYLNNARLKLGERDRTTAILKAAEYGLIDWPSRHQD